MSTPILTTKLYIPPLRTEVVQRPRLIERLNEGLHRNQGFARKLTLISAPAGFGKTTLVSQWISQQGDGRRIKGEARENHPSRVAWLSLDEGDNDPARFLVYFVAALRTIAKDLGEGMLEMLQSPGFAEADTLPATESILTTLLNEVTTVPDDIVLVLDDYHVIDVKPIDDALTFLLEHLPPQMHLIITTREDPDLPLPRYRARGQMTEVRVTDLRFTDSEAAEFLNQVMGLDLSAENIATLEGRTEGWIAGLQLAALSMQGRDDISSFVRAFAGHDRYILDYLIEEVLQSQPERVRSFLLQTSILNRLSGPLCDAVTGQEGAKELLEALERGNLFVVPLDDMRNWYRYHRLFADVLQARLTEEQPAQVRGLHRRASEWHERNELPVDALHHALAAEDFERAAGLAELAWPAMDASFQSATWLGWVKALPEELVSTRPVLSVGYAWALLDSGEIEAGEARLENAERWLDATTDTSERPEVPSAGFDADASSSFSNIGANRSASAMVIADQEQFQSLPATIAAARAYIAQALGDISGSVKYARRALDLLPEEEYERRGMAGALLGLAYWASGDLEAAQRSFAEGMANFQMAGNTQLAISGTYVLADIQVAQGRLHDAASTYEQSLQLVNEQGERVLRGTADLFLGLSTLDRELGNLEAAREHLLRSEELGVQAGLPDWQHRWCLAQARIKKAQGDLDGALDLLDQAERLHFRNPLPDVRPTAALKTQVWIAQGRLKEARNWASARSLSAGGELSYLREFEYVTLARLLIAEYKSDREPAPRGGDGSDRSIHEAIGLLERLRKEAEEGGRIGSEIEILLLQALAHEAQGNIRLALTPLERALMLAEPQGYVRVFVDEGPPMANLLARMKDGATRPPDEEDGWTKVYLDKLLAAFEAEDQKSEDQSEPLPVLPAQPLSEPMNSPSAVIVHVPIADDPENERVNDGQEPVALPDPPGDPSQFIASGWIPWDRIPLGGSPWEILRKAGIVLGVLSALVALSLNAPRLWKEQIRPGLREPGILVPHTPTVTQPGPTATLMSPAITPVTVAIEGPATAPLGEKTYFTIVSEGAVRAEWSVGGFQGNAVISVEPISPFHEIFVEPTDAGRVGDTFTVQVTAFNAEGQSVSTDKRFQVIAD